MENGRDMTVGGWVLYQSRTPKHDIHVLREYLALPTPASKRRLGYLVFLGVILQFHSQSLCPVTVCLEPADLNTVRMLLVAAETIVVCLDALNALSQYRSQYNGSEGITPEAGQAFHEASRVRILSSWSRLLMVT
jgi:hypothetical protein